MFLKSLFLIFINFFISSETYALTETERLKIAECNKKYMHRDMHPLIILEVGEVCGSLVRGKVQKKRAICMLNEFKKLRDELQFQYAEEMKFYCEMKFKKPK